MGKFLRYYLTELVFGDLLPVTVGMALLCFIPPATPWLTLTFFLVLTGLIAAEDYPVRKHLPIRRRP